MKSVAQPSKKIPFQGKTSSNNQQMGGFQSERVNHKSMIQKENLINSSSFIGNDISYNAPFNNSKINQTLRNFNTITVELEKINEQMGNHPLLLQDTQKSQRKHSANSSVNMTKKSQTKSYKRIPLSNIQNNNQIQQLVAQPQFYNTLENIDFNNTLETNFVAPMTTKNKKIPANGQGFSLQPKQKKKIGKRLHKKKPSKDHFTIQNNNQVLAVPIKESEILKQALLEEQTQDQYKSNVNSLPLQQLMLQNQAFLKQNIFQSKPSQPQIKSNIINYQMSQPQLQQPSQQSTERNLSLNEIKKIHQRSERAILGINYERDIQIIDQEKPIISINKPKNPPQQCESRCSNDQVCQLKKNNQQIDQILSNYQSLCQELDQDLKQLAQQLPKSKYQMNEVPQVLIADFNETEDYKKLSPTNNEEIKEDDIFKESHFIQKQVNNLASVQNLAKNGYNGLCSENEFNSDKSFSIEESSMNNDNNNDDQFEETKRDIANNEEECFLLTAQQHDNNLPYQESVTSYNTADFTKFSIGELSRSNKKHGFVIQSNQQLKQQLNNRVDLLEEGLQLSLRIILKLSKQFNSQELMNYSFLEQIDELNNVESLVDLLKFINSDTDAFLVKCPKIQSLLKNSQQLIKTKDERSKTSGNMKHNNQILTDEQMDYRQPDIQKQLSAYETNQNVRSPISPQVNLVSSAITPIKIQENNRPSLIDTFNLVGISKNVRQEEIDAQLTLRNHEIFEDIDVNRESNLFSQANTSTYILENNQFFQPVQQTQKKNYKRTSDNSPMVINRISDISGHTQQNILKSELESSELEQEFESSLNSQIDSNYNFHSSLNDPHYCTSRQHSQITVPEKSNPRLETIIARDQQEPMMIKNNKNDRFLSMLNQDTENKALDNWKSQQISKLNFTNVDTQNGQGTKTQMANQRRINYSLQPETQEQNDEYQYSEEEEEHHNDSHLEMMISQVSTSHLQKLNPQKSSEDSFRDEDDGRIMAYLERIETARNRETKNSQRESAENDLAVSKSLSSIEYAVNKFLGGFTTLKSEISQLKETVLPSNQSNQKTNINNSEIKFD